MEAKCLVVYWFTACNAMHQDLAWPPVTSFIELAWLLLVTTANVNHVCGSRNKYQYSRLVGIHRIH